MLAVAAQTALGAEVESLVSWLCVTASNDIYNVVVAVADKVILCIGQDV